jgi:hypothetical protein
MKCVNCDDISLYEYRLVQDKSLFYCGKHLPKFLDGMRKAGNLPTTTHMTDTVDDALATLETAPAKSKKKSKAAKTEVEESVVEEPEAEPSTTEEINESNS